MKDFEARRLGLHGSDIYSRLGINYNGESHQDHFSVALNREAYKFFYSTITFKNFYALKTRVDLIRQKTNDGTLELKDVHPTSLEYTLMEFRTLENFLIATGFEINFKATLIQNGFVVHIIDKSTSAKLHQEQKERPIPTEELIGLGGFEFNPLKKKNYLVGITEKSIGFHTMLLKPEYAKALDKTPRVSQLANDYRKLRNKIHLLGESHFGISYDSTPFEDLIRDLVDFINTDIVDSSNRLNRKWNFNFTELERINFFDGDLAKE